MVSGARPLTSLHRTVLDPHSDRIKTMPPDEENSLEFQYSDLRFDRKVEPRDLVEKIHSHVTIDIGLHEDRVIGVHFLPTENWPQRVKIYCKDSESKDTLKQRGLDLYGGHIKLFEPGHGVKKVEIKNVPGHMPSHLIKEILGEFGHIVQFRHEKYRLRSGRQIEWTTGNRIAWMREVENMPPIIKVQWNSKEVVLNVWHYGQTDKFCRHCKDIVSKDHQCHNAPQKKCFECGSPSHLKGDCPGLSCFKCGEKGHIAPSCPNGIVKESFVNKFSGKVKPGFNSAFHSGATGNSKDINPPPQTAGTDKNGKEQQVNIDSEEEFPGLKHTEVSRKAKGNEEKGELKEEVSNGNSGKLKKTSPGKKTRRRRKRTRVRTGYVPSLITDFLKANSPKSTDETDFASCVETDEENTDEVDEQETPEVHEQDEPELVTEGEAKEESGNGAGVDITITPPEDENTETVTVQQKEEKDTQNTEELKDNITVKQGEQRSMETEEELKNMDVDDIAQNGVEMVMFGGSNCEDLEKYLTGDDGIKIKPRVLFEGGLRIDKITDKLDEVGDETKKKEIKLVGVHVGSADFPYDGLEDQELKLGQYLGQLMEIDRACPGVSIVICSIPLRIQHYPSQLQKTINDQIQGFNIKLKEIADRSPRIRFCNTFPYLADKDGPSPALYRMQETDPNGVHLNQTGKQELAKAIAEEVKSIVRQRSAGQAVVQGEQLAEPVIQEVRPRTRSAEAVGTEEIISSHSDTRHV